MPDNPIEPKFPSDADQPQWAKNVAIYIRAFAFIIGSLAVLLIAINTFASSVVDEKTFVGSGLRYIIERFFDRPTLARIDSANGNGFVYYETDRAGGNTADGRFATVNGSPLLISNIKAGIVLRARDGVNMRSEPTSSSQLIAIIDTGSCVTTREGKISKVTDLGGWIPVRRSECR